MRKARIMPDNIEYRFHVTGMDCPSCASKIQKAAYSIQGIDTVNVSMASQIMTIGAKVGADIGRLKDVINELGYQLDLAGENHAADRSPALAHITPSYKKALAAVIFLNLAYGVVELSGGFFANSQALKADALDFFGDGLITLAGLVAMGWTLIWRARAALTQGIFLGALGLGVLITTVYRIFVLEQPEAELMGIYAAIALCVNIAAALILIPHRSGDSNVRAVWLFSRNDAIGNGAVIIAAGFVAWTKTSWPDLIVAAVIAGLFLHSAYSIVKDAMKELQENS